jgi:hypothetical protein
VTAIGYISDKQSVEYTPEAGVLIDLSCYITEPPADEVDFETVETPTLCNPQASKTNVGPRTLTLSLLWTDDWMTAIDPLFGTSGELDWRISSETGPGYTYAVTWPSTHGISAPFGESIVVEVTLGVSDRVPLDALP